MEFMQTKSEEMNASLHPKRRMSRLGVVLCSFYLLIIATCLALSLSAGGDFKGQFVFMQLPIALQEALLVSLLQAVGLVSWLAELGWMEAYLLLGLPTFVALYAFGWVIETAVRRMMRAESHG
jgi:hypothetical protein